jgi:hypothetical protein
VCVLDTIYGLVTKKIAVGNLRKIIVTPKKDDRHQVMAKAENRKNEN